MTCASSTHSIFSHTVLVVLARSVSANKGDNAKKIKIGKEVISHPPANSTMAAIRSATGESLRSLAIDHQYNFSLHFFFLKVIDYILQGTGKCFFV